MKYFESIEKSAEYLRLAVPMMSRQAAALHPVSYAVWYEYVAGNNPSLKAAVDAHTQNGAVLDEKTTAELFLRHIADRDEKLAQRVTDGYAKVMADMSDSASQAGDTASRFGDVLAKLSGVSAGARPVSATEIDELLEHTRGMQGSIFSLKGSLDESRREISQLREEVMKAREDALIDGLTGLANRKGFDAELLACLEARPEDAQGPSLLLADIDFFKQVNDTYGHLFGDKVLRGVAQILKGNVKGKDTAARHGGEEFAVLLPDTPLAGAGHLAEKIRADLERCRIKRGDSGELVAHITASFGVATYRVGEAVESFVARADDALYSSKKQGRNRVTVAA
jgi:diguanylate cyclase